MERGVCEEAVAGVVAVGVGARLKAEVNGVEPEENVKRRMV